MYRFMKKHMSRVVSVLLLVCMMLSYIALPASALFGGGGAVSDLLSKKDISLITDSIQTNIEDYFDTEAIYQLPATVSDHDEISVIVVLEEDSLLKAYTEKNTSLSFGAFATGAEAQAIAAGIDAKRGELIGLLNADGISYTVGELYDTVLAGFEINLKAKDFKAVSSLLSSKAKLIVGETYLMPLVTEVVENDVDVYETGIFDSSSSTHQGDGVVIAVLDTGLDYTHTAFAEANFTTSKEAFTISGMAEIIAKTTAAGFTANLTASDVYINKKVPYAYDYADKDADVFPINSDHGTHVAGVIAGKDDVITGVAPNAQLAIMKVFSDFQTGAKTSWIMAALEDCVKLGVDVINMSLGSSCGFAREVDEEYINEVYDSIKAAGISLITAASNDNNATAGSEKNGSNPLTSNPDSGTVGSPATYSASLCVASVDGVKTPYLKHNNEIMYFTEANTSAAKTKDFVEDVLKTVGNPDSYDFEYVTIPGIGRSSDYMQDPSFYAGKIVLVKRGDTTFEEKIRIALKEKGAAGIIIYNNVSGTISMAVGEDVGAACSISQDDGEKLAAAETGIIHISKSQVAGPFMSSFSSWGPTSDLQIKPEITGHGGEILSAIPGQAYDRLSGTSMACPNVAGATALIRQYVKEGHFGNLSTQEVTAVVNRLMMSTADIIYNKIGLPSSIRKQGAGLVNIGKAGSSLTYITTYDKDGNAMDKTKLELGDDKGKTGVYTMSFTVNNFGSTAVVYNIGGTVITEGVSPTYTSHGDTTVTMDGYLLAGTQIVVESVTGAGTAAGNTVTVNANSEAKITVKVTLSEEDKNYLNNSFAHGMYVEGFITLDAQSGIDMSVPMLTYYGDWTEAPIFDEEYYDTHPDEVNNGIDPDDKIMADAYATRVIGGLYSDYIAELGTYYFQQNPAATQIAASKEHIAISNQEGDENSSTVCSIRSINAGLLRNVKELNISVVDTSTGKEIYNKTQYNQRKSYSQGSTIYASSIEMDFYALEQNLKNNTKYEVTVTAYIDFGEKADQKNARNVFSFPLYVDFEAPIVTDVTYRTEYDKTTKKTTLYADLSVYDNHYAMGMQVGQITPAEEGSQYAFTMNSFGKYVTPIYSTFNSTTTVSVNLTDYISQLKNSAGLDQNGNGNSIDYNNNSFIVSCYDYAMNAATYEIRLPDEFMYMYFGEEEIKMSPNETLNISTVLNIYPGSSWIEVLDFESSDKAVADIVNQTIVAKGSGTATVTATGKNSKGEPVTASVKITVLKEGDEGYVGGYTEPSVNRFGLTGYKTLKAFYALSSEEREIGLTDNVYDFEDSSNYSLSMFPSEKVELTYMLDSYSPDDTEIIYSVGRDDIASVDEKGVITAKAEGSTVVFVTVKFKGQSTLYSDRVNIEVKDPFTTNSIYLMSYKGNGGEVIIPDDRGITTIQSYAFSNYEYVDKDLSAGDVIDEEDPYYIKPQHIGEDTITKVVIPEGVTTIESYAFAGLTALEEVVFPTTLTKIGIYAFDGCTKLKTLSTKVGDTVHQNNLDYVKFINKSAFGSCAIEDISLGSVVAVGDYAFRNCKLNFIELPASAQSVGAFAFADNKTLSSVEFQAAKIKLGASAFLNCELLSEISVNASVIPAYTFSGCKELTNVTLGADVAVIGEYAFAGTKVSQFQLDSKNQSFKLSTDGAMLLSADGKELVLAAPLYAGTANTVTLEGITSIGTGAFASNVKIFKVIALDVENIGAYAFAGCTGLGEIKINAVKTVDDRAFYGSGLKTLPDLAAAIEVGDYAFAATQIAEVLLTNAGVEMGEYAFALNENLKKVVIADNAVIGEAAFFCPVYMADFDTTGNLSLTYYTPETYEVTDDKGNVIETYHYYAYNFKLGVLSVLQELTIGSNVTIGDYAFYGNGKLEKVTLGEGAAIGEYAFYNNASLKEIDLSKVISIGDFAFAGSITRQFSVKDNTVENFAFIRDYVNGEVVIKDFRYSGHAAVLEEVNLSAAATLGEGIFANNKVLRSVTFNNALTALPAKSFYGCTALESVALPAGVTEIGEMAFFSSGLEQIDISNVESIGEKAFTYTYLSSVKFKQGAAVGDYAFAYCYHLAAAENLGEVVSIGDYGFWGVALTEIDLTSATTVGDYAFGESAVTEVTFGSALAELGENPFKSCRIETFGKYQDIIFHDRVVGSELVETFNISDTVKVMGGVLYQIVPKGLELVSYPVAKDTLSYKVEPGTVRISAHAFTGSNIKNVTLSEELTSIGDKAFYDCKELAVVVFTGYYAPALEEAYDVNYATEENLPTTGMAGSEGLGISKFYMWNVSSSPNNFYFGANFVDYIGHVKNNLVMVRPSNGVRYDSMILGQYFKTVVDGAPAAIQATKDVIAMIDKLPDAKNITLADEPAVVAARRAFDLLPNDEQKGLVKNKSKLTAAESQIEFLKNRDAGTNTPGDDPNVGGSKLLAFLASYWWILVIAIVVIGGAIVAVILIRRKMNAQTKAPAVAAEEAAPAMADATEAEAEAEAAEEAAESETEQPEATEPEVTESEVTEPEVTEPEAVEPETTEAEVSETEDEEPKQDR